MSKFDPKLDKTIKELGNQKEVGALIVGVYQYNGGEKKVGMSRVFEDYKTKQIGRKGTGRLGWDDVQFLKEHFAELEEILEA